MSDKNSKLSRRKVLAGLGTIGAAGAGAGIGTSALFSDEESFTNNSITAGTLNMSVTASVEAANDYWAEQVNLQDLEATADGEAVTGLQVEDVKPGDWGIICFEIDIGENPGYVRTTTEGLTTSENGYIEPEPTDGTAENDPNDKDGAGELQNFMLAEVYQSFDENEDSDPPRSYLSPDGGDPVAPKGSTVQETYNAFSYSPFILDSDGDAVEVGSGADAAEWCLLLYLPEDVGNRVQSDSFSFDLKFSAEQVRNNDVSTEVTKFQNDPWLTNAQTENGGVFWNHPGDDNELALEPGDEFTDLPSPGQPIYVNTTEEPIDITVGAGGPTTTLNTGAYNGSDFHSAGSGAPWVRIPTGAGTPHPPSGAPNHELVSVTGTTDGSEVEWQEV